MKLDTNAFLAEGLKVCLVFENHQYEALDRREQATDRSAFSPENLARNFILASSSKALGPSGCMDLLLAKRNRNM